LHQKKLVKILNQKEISSADYILSEEHSIDSLRETNYTKEKGNSF